MAPEDAAAHGDRGAVLLAAARWDDALVAFTRSAQVAPTAGAHTARGAVLFRLGRHDEALAAFNDALGLDPDSPAALVHKAAALEATGRLAEAALAALEALAVEPLSVAAHTVRGLVSLQLGDVARADSCFVAAIEAGPDRAMVALALAGVTSWARGDAAAARLRFAQAIDEGLDAGLGLATFAVAEARALALAGLGRTDDAIALLRGAAATRAPHDRSRPTLYDTFASGPFGPPPGLDELRSIALG